MERKNYRKNGHSSSKGYCYYNDLGQTEKKKKNHIQHPVSKLDTLAGIAIKYGVDVADIKKLNGLATDIQMFALETLQIPLPGKHPPSPCLSNGSKTQGHTSYEQSPHCHVQRNLLDSFQSLGLKSIPRRKVSPAMSSLQGYYGLEPIRQRPASEGCEMTVYWKNEAQGLEDGPLLEPFTSHRKSKSLANVMLAENGALADVRESESDEWSDKFIRRQQKSEADFSNTCTPELLLKEDKSTSAGFPAITVKGLALRPKAAAANRADSDSCSFNPVPLDLGNSFLSNRLSGVRKSSSTSSLQDQESSIWSSSKWSLKPDLQALSSVAIPRPIFDGLPKPIYLKIVQCMESPRSRVPSLVPQHSVVCLSGNSILILQ